MGVEATVREDLENLADARRLCNWMFSQFSHTVRGNVVEVGAGIGTFTELLFTAGADRVLAIEPEPDSANILSDRFRDDPRVRVVREELPEAPSLAAEAGTFDMVLCQNVLEHIEDDAAACVAMAAALRPGGWLMLLVPAHPRLFGPLDAAYGHHRRYTRDAVRAVVSGAGLQIHDLYSFNLLGVPGWWVKNRRSDPRLDPLSLRAYEALLTLWRPVEQRWRLPWGLSVIARARKATS